MKSTYWATLILSLFVSHAFAQDAERTRPLAKYLQGLEQEYGITFSYVDELVSEREVLITTDQDISLKELLLVLEREVQLRFEQIDSQYVLVRPFSGSDLIRICGFVQDEEGKPVSELLVQTEEPGVGAVTDRKGFFELTVPYQSIVTFYHLGFVTKRREAHSFFGAACKEIPMKPTVAFLEELTIRDYLTVGIIKEKKDLKILPQELKILPGLIEPDILQSIQQAPGVISPYETVSGIHVRGGTPDQNLVLWNGIKTYHQGHFFGMLSAFNPYITDEVKFIKNGTSPRYGGRVSGVIDIRSSEEVASEFSGGAGLNLINADAYVHIPVVKDKLSVMISGRRSFTDLWESFTYNQYAKRVFQNTKIKDEASSSTSLSDNAFYFSDFNTNITFEPTAHDRILISTLYNKNDLNFSSVEDQTGRELKDELRTENEGYSLKWKHNTERLSLSTEVNYAKYLLDYRFSDTYQDTTQTSSKKNLISDWGIRSQLNYRFNKIHQMMVGFEYADNTTRYAYEDSGPLYQLVLDQDNRTIQTHSGYAEYQFEGQKTYVSLGARVNHYPGLDKWYLEPRVYLRQKIIEPLHFSLSGEYRTQTISQIKESVVSDLSLENQVWKLASKERFPVIDSYQVTAGLMFERNDWILDVEGYYKEIDGITSLTFGFLNPLDNEYRTGKSAIRGADIFLKKQITHYKTWLGYTYLFTENEFAGLNNGNPFPGNWNIEHQVKWSHFYTWKQLQFSLGWSWHTGKAFTEVTADSATAGPVAVQFDGINQQNLPIYHRLDFSAVYDFQPRKNTNIKYRIGLSILNLYNRRNLLNREYRTTPSLNNELIDTRIYSLGITPNLVFRIFW